MPDRSGNPYQGITYSTPSHNLPLGDVNIQRQRRRPDLYPALHLDRLSRTPFAAPDPLPIPTAFAQKQNNGPRLPFLHHPALNAQVYVLSLAR